MKNKFVVAILIMLIMLSIPNTVLGTSAKFTLGSSSYYIDQVPYTMDDAAPYIKENRIFVPLRYIALVCGVSPKNIYYDAYNQTIKLIKDDGVEIKLRLGDKNMLIDGVVVTMDVEPEVVNDRVYLPARYVALALGREVNWNEEFQAIYVHVENYVDEAVQELEKKNYGEAIKKLKKLNEVSPNNSYGYYLLGKAYFELTNFNATIENCTKAIEKFPTNDEAYYLRARAKYKLYLMNSGDVSDIIADVNKAIETSLNNTMYYANRGDLYIALGDYEKALKDYNKVIEQDSQYQWAYCGRAIVYYYTKGGREAFEEELKNILEKFPENEFAKKGIGLVQSNAGISFTMYDWK